MNDVSIIERTITISLPEWVCDEKYEYSVYRNGSPYELIRSDNYFSEELFKRLPWKELCLHSWGPWVEFEHNPAIHGYDGMCIYDQLVEFLEDFKKIPDEEFIQEVVYE